MIGPAGTQSVEALIDEVREEAHDRLSTAYDALRGEELEPPTTPWTPQIGQYNELVIEHPSRQPENPLAAILGHVSDAERRYFAACELEAVADERGFPSHQHHALAGHTHLSEDLRRLRHDLRHDAHEAIEQRLTVDRLDGAGSPRARIEDPATGWRQNVAFGPLESDSDRKMKLDTYLGDAPQNVLENTRQRLLDK